MLVGLAGLLAGYDGNFEFKSGTTYPPEMRYGLWRLYMATYGVLMVPVAWYTCKGLKWNHLSCHLVTLMVLFGARRSSRTCQQPSVLKLTLVPPRLPI